MVSTATQIAPAQVAPAETEESQPEKLLTAEEYYATCCLERSELINGRVVELMPPGFEHGEIAANIASYLKSFLRGKALGRVSVEGGFRLKRNPDTVRGPDVSFVEAARLQNANTRTFIEGAPTLAVEINSPGDRPGEIEDKVQLYLERGVRLVWVVDPDKRSVTVRTPDGEPVTLNEGDTLEGGDALPGFKLPLREIFE